MPLYAGRMIHQFDHRAASVVVNEANLHNAALSGDVSAEMKADPAFLTTPQYWLVETASVIVRLGEPVFKIRDRIKRHGIHLRSSNYELYADLNRRFNAVIADHSDVVEIYPIDESFFRLPTLPNGLGDVATAHQVGKT